MISPIAKGQGPWLWGMAALQGCYQW